MYCDCQLTDTTLYCCNYSCNTVCQHAYIRYTYMFTNRCMMYSTHSGCNRMVLHPLEYYNKSNQIEAIWNRGGQPCVTQDGTAPPLQSSRSMFLNLCMWLWSNNPSSQINMMHLGKILISHSAEFGVWVHESFVLMAIPCTLIKHNDMNYCHNHFMSEG
jgi:hypothetical protein